MCVTNVYLRIQTKCHCTMMIMHYSTNVDTVYVRIEARARIEARRQEDKSLIEAGSRIEAGPK